MNYFTVSTQTGKSNIILFKLNQHLLNLPVDVPSFHCIEAPCFIMIPSVDVHSHQPIKPYPKKFLN